MKWILTMIFFAACFCVGHAQNLNSLSKEQYRDFVKTIYSEHQKDPQQVGEQSEKIIIGMAGLENRPASHGIFKVDVNFNTNAMLLLVANANKIKRDDKFMAEFKKQCDVVRPQLKTDDERTYFDVFTNLVVKGQQDLK